MRMLKVLAVLVAATAVGAGLIACGGDDNEKEATASPTKAGEATTIEVTAKDFSFDPGDFDVAKGTPVTIKVTNDGSASHTLTVYTDEEYTDPVKDADTGTIKGGGNGEFTVTFDKAADYYFRCEFHPTQMEGEIEVK